MIIPVLDGQLAWKPEPEYVDDDGVFGDADVPHPL